MPFECKVIALGQLFGEFSILAESEASLGLRNLAPVERLVDVSNTATDRDVAALMTLTEIKAIVPRSDPLNQWLEDLPGHVSAILVYFSEWQTDQKAVDEAQPLRG